MVFAIALSAAPTDAFAQSGPQARPEQPQLAQSIAVPQPLSAEDVKRYRLLFRIQEHGQWQRADREMRKLRDKLLIGHLLAQRYLHPTRYRSRYRELSRWLSRYADHPDSPVIYRLAMKRKPRNARSPVRPKNGGVPAAFEYQWTPETTYKARSRAGRRIVAQVRRDARRGRLTRARNLANSKRSARILGKTGLDVARAYLGFGYFFRGDTASAYRYAGPAADRSGAIAPFGAWVAGLAAFRLERYADAVRHFETMANSENVGAWERSAAAFWAARSNIRARRPNAVARWLEVAAEESRTFYGRIAIRLLGTDHEDDWELPRLDDERLSVLEDTPGSLRAFALMQVGQNWRAERELRFLARTGNRDETEALLALAEAQRMPSLSLRTGRILRAREGVPRFGALYPLPPWQPKKGFSIDRAVVYAFMRQESGFSVRAKSKAGARGLMQLMPATAGYMANTRYRGRNRDKLFDPTLNVTLGERYLDYLIRHEAVQGDMLLLAAAYNGGPGNLSKWMRRAEKERALDPLMFIESIPARETRLFIERVLANLWIYRSRLGQPAPSLDALARGERPIYKSVEGIQIGESSDVRN